MLMSPAMVQTDHICVIPDSVKGKIISSAKNPKPKTNHEKT
jgi:hypothetical protein